MRKKYLLASIQEVSTAISSRTVVPILTGMKIDVMQAAIILTGSNSDITIQSSIPKTITLPVDSDPSDTDEMIEGDPVQEEIITNITPGSIILPVPHFPEIIKKLPEDTVQIEVDENYKTTITSGKAIFTLYGQSVEEYPHINIQKHDDHVKIKAADLKRLIRQTAFAVSQMETRPILTGVHIGIGDIEVTFTATDSHRLSTSTVGVKAHQLNQTNIVIPGKSLQELNRILDNDEEVIHITILENQVLFYTDHLFFLSRLLNGNYPDTSKLIPSNSETTLHVQTKELVQTIERAALLSNRDQNNVIRLDTLDDHTIEITSNSPEIGNVKEQLTAISITGEEIKISFSSKYLLDTLRTIDEDKVQIDFTGAMRPFIITTPKNNQILQLILPVRTF